MNVTVENTLSVISNTMNRRVTRGMVRQLNEEDDEGSVGNLVHNAGRRMLTAEQVEQVERSKALLMPGRESGSSKGTRKTEVGIPVVLFIDVSNEGYDIR